MADEFRDADGEHVVVAEAEFADGDGVVLVDDGEDAGFLEQAVEGVEQVGGAAFGLDILGGQEDLRDEDVEIREQGAVGAHQACLADSGTGLACADVLRVFVETEG